MAGSLPAVVFNFNRFLFSLISTSVAVIKKINLKYLKPEKQEGVYESEIHKIYLFLHNQVYP